jgi:tripartite-type tricarboxylate transporter receptor subunit TctC
MSSCLPCALVFAAACLAANTAPAQDAAEAFYRGKTVTITVGSAVGGGYDTYARLVGRHLGKHIPGNPTVVVQNIPGAGSNKAASYVALQAPKDGTAIGAIQSGAILQPLISDQPIPHDPAKFIMLGSANRSVYFCVVRSDAPIKSFQEAFDKEVIIGTSGEGATLRELPILLINVLGVKLRLIGGYAGSREIMIAIERNEVQGMCGMDWSSFLTQQRDWISSGFVRLLAQEDLRGHPEMNKVGVPRTITFAKTEEDRQVMEMIYSQNLFGRPYLVPPGVPADRVAALRGALAAMLQDKALLAEAEKSRGGAAGAGGQALRLAAQGHRAGKAIPDLQAAGKVGRPAACERAIDLKAARAISAIECEAAVSCAPQRGVITRSGLSLDPTFFLCCEPWTKIQSLCHQTKVAAHFERDVPRLVVQHLDQADDIQCSACIGVLPSPFRCHRYK